MNTEKIKFIYLPFIGFLYILNLKLIKIIPIPAFIQDSEPNYITFFIAFMIVTLIPYLLVIRVVVNKISRHFNNVLVSGAFIFFLMLSYFFLIIYIFSNTQYLQTNRPLVYEYCGTDFNQKYREAIETNNPNICLNKDLFSDLETIKLQSTGELYCLTPTNKSIFISSTREFDSFKTSCISAMARDLHDSNICNLIKENNLPYPYRYPYVGIAEGDISGCLEDYNSKEDRNLGF